MKLPSEIAIFGKIHKIKKLKTHVIIDGMLADGYFDPEKLEIGVNVNSPNPTQVLVHELFHAMFQRVSLVQAKIPLEIEEIIVDSFSTFLVETFSLRLLKKDLKKISPPPQPPLDQ